jgi:predicted hydrocarbon binding protein
MEDHLEKLKTELRVEGGHLMFQSQDLLMISCSWFTSMQLELENTLGTMGTASLIKTAARTWGERMHGIYKSQVQGKTLEEKIRYILETYNFKGWGRAELVEFNDTPPRIVVRKIDPYFENAYKGSVDEPRCYIYLGVMAIISGFAKSEQFPDLEVNETKCIAKDDPHCEFVIESSSPE